MLVYHGSYCVVAKPNFDVGRKRLDFGQGFYVTTLPLQAEQWAVRKAYENDVSPALVSIYDYHEDNDLRILHFDTYDKSWLDFVVGNRRSSSVDVPQLYDVVIGGIADDRVIDTINYYIEEIEVGRDSVELVNLTLRQLSYQRPNDQICFCSQQALNYLNFQSSYEVSR